MDGTGATDPQDHEHHCDSCGAPESLLYAVRRKYVSAGSPDTPGFERVLDEVEQWCFACCTHYPHVPVIE